VLEDRVKELEELWEHDHHTIELLSIYIPKLTDILIRYWGASGRHRTAVLGDLRGIRDALDKKKKPYNNIYNSIELDDG